MLFTPHLDTVPAADTWHFPPFSGKIYKGRIYGRGATDCKVNAAAALYLIKKLKKEKIKLDNLDLVFAFCGDEETGSRYGIFPLMKELGAIDYGIVLDADEFNIVIAQKGLLHLRVEVFGREAHGAYPQRGVNAIEKSVNILQEIMRKKMSCQAHRLLKKPTLNIGRIGGGEKVNIVAGFAFFELDIRYIPSMSREKIIQGIENIIKRRKVKYKIKILAHQLPVEVDKEKLFIKILREVLKKNSLKPLFVPSFGATVINFLKEKGIDSIAFGFGSKGRAHTKDEYARIDNLLKGIGVLLDYIKEMDKYLASGLKKV